MSQPLVSIIMGSDTDLPVMEEATGVLNQFEIKYELTIISAHRTPERMFDYAKTVHKRGIKVVIAGAGGAAHLPGMVSSLTPLPVIGVPIKSSNSIDGWDSILSILQMPNGVPVATVALGGSKNAGVLAAEIIGSADATIMKKVLAYKEYLKDQVAEKIKKIEKKGYSTGFDKK